MSANNVGGSRPVPKNVTTDVSPEKETELEGKTTAGASVKKEEGTAPIKKGTIPTPEETKKLLAQYDVTISNDDGKDEDNIFFGAFEDSSDFEGLDVEALRTAALKNAGVASEPESSNIPEIVVTPPDNEPVTPPDNEPVIPQIVVTPPDNEPVIPQNVVTPPDDMFSADLVEKQLKSSSKLLAKVQALTDKVTNAFIAFVNRFRPAPETAEVMAGAVGQLIDLSVPETSNDTEAEKVVDELASQLEGDPSAMLGSMEEKGLHDVIADLKSTIRVANSKNLKVIKQALMDHSEKYPALSKMSFEEREVMINGALIAAKIGNASEKTGVRDLESRGYLIGKIPPQKMMLVELVLSMNPSNAIAQLEVWLDEKGIDFRKAISRADDKTAERFVEDVHTLFEGDELEVDPDPKFPYVDEEKEYEKRQRVIDLRATSKDTPEETMRARRKVLEDIVSKDKEKFLRPTSEHKVTPSKKYFKTVFEPVIDELKDPHTHANFKKRNADKAGFKAVKDAYSNLVESGGLTESVIKQMETLQSTIADQLVQKGANSAIADLMSKAVMVGQKLAVWEGDSSDEVTYLGSTATGKDFQATMDTAMEIAGKDLPTIKDMLLNNHLVTDGSFAKNLHRLEVADKIQPRG